MLNYRYLSKAQVKRPSSRSDFLFPQLENDEIFKSITSAGDLHHHNPHFPQAPHFAENCWFRSDGLYEDVSIINCSSLMKRLETESVESPAMYKRLTCLIHEYCRKKISWQTLVKFGYNILGDREDLKASLNALRSPSVYKPSATDLFGEEVFDCSAVEQDPYKTKRFATTPKKRAKRGTGKHRAPSAHKKRQRVQKRVDLPSLQGLGSLVSNADGTPINIQLQLQTTKHRHRKGKVCPRCALNQMLRASKKACATATPVLQQA